MADRLIERAGCVATRFVNNVPLKIGGAFKAGEEIGVVKGWSSASDGAGPTIRYFKVFDKASLTATGDPLAMKYAKLMKAHEVMWSTTEKEMPQRNVTGPAHISPQSVFVLVSHILGSTRSVRGTLSPTDNAQTCTRNPP